MAAFVNKYGRKGGRGVRPALLLPKLIAVAIYVGGVVTASALWFGQGWSGMEASDPRRLWLVEAVSKLFVWLIVPALIAALVLGLALFGRHAAVFARMRWWQAKMGLLTLGLPVAHLFMSSRLEMLREAAQREVEAEGAAAEFGWGLAAVIAWVLILLVLGRLKPRLGQKVMTASESRCGKELA